MATSEKTRKELAIWRDRLRFARDIWKHKGLIGTSHTGTMRILMEMYRGNQWAHNPYLLGDSDPDQLRTVNKVFPVANQFEAQIASRNPKVKVFPTTRASAGHALSVETLLNNDIKQIRYARQSNRAFRSHLFAPFGALRHGFTPSEEFSKESASVKRNDRLIELYQPAQPDRPWVKNMHPWDILMDPTRESLHTDDGVEWVAFRDVMHRQDILDTPDMSSSKAVREMAGNVGTDWADMLKRIHEGHVDPDANDKIEVWSVYEIREKTWFQMTLDGPEEWLRDPADWPIDWGQLPYNLFVTNEQMDTPIPLSMMDQMASIQEEYNILRTMMTRMVRNLRRVVFADENKFSDSTDLNKLNTADLVEFFGMKGPPGDSIHQATVGGFPQEMFLYLGQLEEDARETVGQSKMARGQRINVESATEAGFVQGGEDVSVGRIASAFETFNKEVIQVYLAARRQTMALSGPEEVRAPGQAGGPAQFASVGPASLAGGFELEIEYGSTRPRDHGREAQEALADFEVASAAPGLFNTAYFARRYAEARSHSVEEALTEDALTASKVKTFDSVLRDAGPGSEQPAEPRPTLDANVIASIPSGGVQ